VINLFHLQQGTALMVTRIEPALLTVGRIADEVGESLSRVAYVLNTRKHIRPKARAGTLRLYAACAIAQVRHELHAIDARRSQRGGDR
jgi:predicted transcriptional regulator